MKYNPAQYKNFSRLKYLEEQSSILKNILIKNNMNQIDLAKKLGVSPIRLNRWIKKKHLMDPFILSNLKIME